MRLSKKAIQEFKELQQKEFGQKLTDAEAEEQANNLLGFFKLLMEIDQRQKKKKK